MWTATGHLAVLGRAIVQWSSNLLLDEVQVLGQLQSVLLHHLLQPVGFHQVIKHHQRSVFMLERKQTMLFRETLEKESAIIT